MSPSLYHFFILGVTKLNSMLLFGGNNRSNVLVLSPINGWRVKGTLSLKILVLWLHEMEFYDSWHSWPMHKKVLYIFSIFFLFWKSQNLLQCSFWRIQKVQYFSCFEVVLLCISPTNGSTIKGTLLQKILLLWLSELEFCDSRKPQNIIKHKMVHDCWVYWSNSYTAYNCLTMNF